MISIKLPMMFFTVRTNNPKILFSWAPKSLQTVTAVMKLKDFLAPWKKAMTNLDSVLKSRDITLLTMVHIVKAMIFYSSHVGRCENWTIKKVERRRIDTFKLWCWSPLDSKEIKPVNPKGNQP